MPVLRTKARISQEIVTEKIGVSRQTYSSIETGKREMSWTVFLALLAYFQNNGLTRGALSKIDGFEEMVSQAIDENTKTNS
ncbi:MAG: helix-turn-helix transcriptional regulator [Lachnospiraceae bacterium]|nr:helix-turn-helix transcriptional regulator [Lachnospiraceae bacterium]